MAKPRNPRGPAGGTGGSGRGTGTPKPDKDLKTNNKELKSLSDAIEKLTLAVANNNVALKNTTNKENNLAKAIADLEKEDTLGAKAGRTAANLGRRTMGALRQDDPVAALLLQGALGVGKLGFKGAKAGISGLMDLAKKKREEKAAKKPSEFELAKKKGLTPKQILAGFGGKGAKDEMMRRAVGPATTAAPAATVGGTGTTPTTSTSGSGSSLVPDVETSGKAGFGIAAVGAGIGAFIAALALGGAAVNAVGGASGVKDMLTAVGEGLSSFDTGGMVGFGALLAAGAIFGAYSGDKEKLTAPIGIAAIGVGIGGFFAGLALGGAATTALGGASGVKDMLTAVGEGLGAFDTQGLVALGSLLAAGAVFGAVGGAGGATMAIGANLGIAVIGLAIGGFFSGLALGAKAYSELGGGSTVKEMLTSVGEGLGSFNEGSLTALSGMLAAGALFGAIGGTGIGLGVAAGANLGIAVIGLAIGGFFTGLATGAKAFKEMGGPQNVKEMLTSVAEGLNSYDTINGDNLLKAAEGLGKLALGIGAFATGDLIGKALDWLLGSDEEEDTLTRVAKSLVAFEEISGPNLRDIGDGISSLAQGLGNLVNIAEDLDPEKIAKIATSVSTLGSANIGNLRQMLAPPGAQGGAPAGEQRPSGGGPGAQGGAPAGEQRPSGGGGRPPIEAASGIGALSARYESKGDVGTISSGAGDPGGKSYGTYQLSSKAGTMEKFLNSPEGQAFAQKYGLDPSQIGTAAFDAAYKNAVAGDKEGFAGAQEAFIKRTHYDPVARAAQEMGYDISDPTIQKALFSQSVQHGLAGNKKILAAAMQQAGPNASTQDVLTSLYTARNQYIGGLSDMDPRIKASLSKRMENELGDALNLASMETANQPPVVAVVPQPAPAQTADAGGGGGGGQTHPPIPPGSGPRGNLDKNIAFNPYADGLSVA